MHRATAGVPTAETGLPSVGSVVWGLDVGIELGTPTVDQVDKITEVMGEWQYEGARFQLHPGDVGWFRRFGGEDTAAAVRTWTRDGRVLAVGLLDGADTLRTAVAPDAQQDVELAERIAADVADTDRGVLPSGRVAVESWAAPIVQSALEGRGWKPDEPWTPLRRVLTDPVETTPVRTEIVGLDATSELVTVLRSAFGSTRLTHERWHAMADGAAFGDARCLLAYDDLDTPTAAVTVWSSGSGRPGLIEPMGVHADHRGHGYGRAITLAAAAALRDLGSSSVVVATPSSNTGGVAAYASAGFEVLPELRDRYREA